MTGKIIKLGANHPRDAFNAALGKLVAQALGTLGWQVLANDLGQVCGGIVGAYSDKPQRDLDKIASAIRNTNWRIQKKRLLAARMGVDPADVSLEDHDDEASPGGPAGAELPDGGVSGEWKHGSPDPTAEDGGGDSAGDDRGHDRTPDVPAGPGGGDDLHQ